MARARWTSTRTARCGLVTEEPTMTNVPATMEPGTGELVGYDDGLPTALRLPVGLMPKAQQSGKTGADWKPEGGKGFPVTDNKFVFTHPIVR